MKMILLQILYAKSFSELDHEDPYTHLTKFYNISGTLGALGNEEDAVFLRLFLCSLISKANK